MIPTIVASPKLYTKPNPVHFKLLVSRYSAAIAETHGIYIVETSARTNAFKGVKYSRIFPE